jgi:CheY-like chemotaxis protein
VAIVDVALPKRDGFSICRAARAERIATPVLMLTARDAVEDRIRGLDAGRGRLFDQAVRRRGTGRAGAGAVAARRPAPANAEGFGGFARRRRERSF